MVFKHIKKFYGNLPQQYDTHLRTIAVILLFSGGIYGIVRTTKYIKNSTHQYGYRQTHEEMEDYLLSKDYEARKKF